MPIHYGSIIAEVKHTFGAIGDGSKDLPADLGLGRIQVIAKRHAIEKIPEGDARRGRLPAHRFQIGAIGVPGVGARTH